MRLLVNATGIYQGIIEDNKDPLNRGRCKVRVLGIHFPETPVEELPWAEPLIPFGGSEANSFLYVPPLKSTVLVSFVNGRVENPLIVGYWRKYSNPVLEDYSKNYDVKDESLFYFKSGKGDAPILRISSLTKKVEIGTKKNSFIIGKGYDFMGENGNSIFQVTPFSIRLLQNKGDNINFLIFNNSGISLETSSTYTLYIQHKKLSVIGRGLVQNLPSQILTEFGIFKEISEGTDINASNAKNLFGEKLYNFINKIIKREGYRPNKSLYENLLGLSIGETEEKELQKALEEIPVENKSVVCNVLELKGSKSFINNLINVKIDNGLKSLSSQSFKKIIGEEKIAEQKIIFGNKKTEIIGGVSETTLKDKEEKIVGDYKKTLMGNSQIIIFGKSGTMIAEGDCSLNMGTGKGEIVFNIPTQKLTIQNSTKVSSPDILVKKEAFDKLKEFVYKIADFLANHQHLSSSPGSPSSMPLYPRPFNVENNLQQKLIDNLAKVPSPTNTFFTNNLEAS